VLSGKVTGLTSFDGSGNVTMLTSLNGVTTSDVAEGTNQYFTTARARTALSTGTGLSYNSTTGIMSLNANSDQITEGTNNLYFTNNRFDNRLGQSTLAQFSDVANTSPGMVMYGLLVRLLVVGVAVHHLVYIKLQRRLSTT
jgi:hypothetical protein